MDAKLNVVGGPFMGQRIQIPRGKLLIGRAEDCDVRPDSGFVSAYHCVLLLDDYTLRVRDLGSKNGTLVNGRRIGTGVTILLHDDMISVGEMNILVDMDPIPAGSDADAEPTVAPCALEATGVFDGDTLQTRIPEVLASAADPTPASPDAHAPSPVPPAPPPSISEAAVPKAMPPSTEENP
jgi:predicted component of type VI protein secretion system